MVKVECANCGTIYRLNNIVSKEKSLMAKIQEFISFFDSLYFWIQIGHRLINFLSSII